MYPQTERTTRIYWFRIFLKRLYKSTTTQRCSRLQHWRCVGVNMPKRYWQLWVKDLPKVPTGQLYWDSSLRPSGPKEPNLPLGPHAPQI